MGIRKSFKKGISPKIPPEINLNDLVRDIEDLRKYIEDLTIFLPLAFCAVNPWNLILGANRAFEDLTGYDEMETLRKPIDILFTEKSKAADFEKTIVKEEKRVTTEFTLLTKTGKNIPVSVSALARRDENRTFVGYFLTILDISETKKFQEELKVKVREQTKTLQEKIEELESFNKMVIGREIKMVELKERIKELEDKLKTSLKANRRLR